MFWIGFKNLHTGEITWLEDQETKEPSEFSTQAEAENQIALFRLTGNGQKPKNFEYVVSEAE